VKHATAMIVPKLGAASKESKLLRWLAKEGDKVERGQPLFGIESATHGARSSAPPKPTDDRPSHAFAC